MSSTDTTDFAQPCVEPQPPERFLDSESIARIQKTIRQVAARLQMSKLEAEDFAGVVWLKLLDNDYEVLRRHEHRSSLSTYLFAVVLNAGRDYRNANWGKWRPSAAAKRLGHLAIQLERLRHRDGYSAHEAAQLVAHEHPDTSLEELTQLQELLPRRTRRRHVGSSVLRNVGETGGVEKRPRRSLCRQRSEKVESALRDSLTELDTLDREMLAQRFGKGRRLSAIARDLGIEQPAIYRRLRRCLKALRTSLRGRGVQTEDVRELVGRTDANVVAFTRPPSS